MNVLSAISTHRRIGAMLGIHPKGDSIASYAFERIANEVIVHPYSLAYANDVSTAARLVRASRSFGRLFRGGALHGGTHGTSQRACTVPRSNTPR